MGWVQDLIDEHTSKMTEKRLPNRCDICDCDVNMNSPTQRETHESGRKHTNFLRMKGY